MQMLQILCSSVITSVLFHLCLKTIYKQISASDTPDMNTSLMVGMCPSPSLFNTNGCLPLLQVAFEFLTPSSAGAVIQVQIYIPNRDRDMFGDQSNCQWLA